MDRFGKDPLAVGLAVPLVWLVYIRVVDGPAAETLVVASRFECRQPARVVTQWPRCSC